MSPGLSELPDSERAVLADLAPSAKLVALVLAEDGRMTQQQLAEETLLSVRTARHALAELEDAGIVTSRVSFMDARQRLYSVAGDGARDRTEERVPAHR
jgi:DNA-binding MarR family transcriptional regulator